MVAVMLAQFSFSPSRQHGVVVTLNHKDKGVRLEHGKGTRVHQGLRGHLGQPALPRWTSVSRVGLGGGTDDGRRAGDVRDRRHFLRTRKGGNLRNTRRGCGHARPRPSLTESPLRRTSERAAFFIIYSA